MDKLLETTTSYVLFGSIAISLDSLESLVIFRQNRLQLIDLNGTLLAEPTRTDVWVIRWQKVRWSSFGVSSGFRNGV